MVSVCCLLWLLEEEIVSDAFADFDVVSRFTERCDTPKQWIFLCCKPLFEAQPPDRHANFYGVSFTVEDLIEASFVSCIVFQNLPIFN